MGLLDRMGRFIDDVLLLPEDVRIHLEMGERALAAEAFDEAEGCFLTALADRPQLARAWVGLALSREGLGDRAGCREALEQACDLVPGDPGLALRAARLALADGDVRSAVRHGRVAAARVSATEPAQAASAWLVLARAERESGHPDRALRDLRKALALRPGDPVVRVELAAAAAELERPREVSAAVRGLSPRDVAPGLASQVGIALARCGMDDAARWLERGASVGDVAAMDRLGRFHLARGRQDLAETWARRAVAAGGGPPALALLGEVLFAGGRYREASESFAAGSEAAGGDLELARAAARTAPLDDPSGLVRAADALERLEPADPAASAARAWACLMRGELAAVRELTSAPTEPRGWLARAAWALARERAGEALRALERFDASVERSAWASPDRVRADALRRDALRRAWKAPDGSLDVVGAVEGVARFAAERGLEDLVRGARDLRDEIDRPVRLAIVGEFNAGKSTLVNALLRAEVAPMGVLPTTARPHVLKSGTDRRVRLVLDDGRTREGRWEALADLLAEAGAEHVEHVEITTPNEVLERVWLVDTPGTNAPMPAHQDRALAVAAHADVVLWVFDATQVGKATERRVLDAVGEAGVPVVAVVNKSDRLAPADLSRACEQVRSLPGVARVLPISAKATLRSRLQTKDDRSEPAPSEAKRRGGLGSPPEVVEGGGGRVGPQTNSFPALERWLADELFPNARAIKRRSCAGRLAMLLDQELVQQAEAGEAGRREVARLEGLEVALRGLGDDLVDTIPGVCRELDRRRERAVAEAAADVVALARPRRPGGVADREDRAFVTDALGNRLEAAIEDAEGLLIEATRPMIESVSGGESSETWSELRTAAAAAVGRYAGYQKGLLEGGRIERFFDAQHTDHEDRESVARVLSAAAADPWEELRPALVEAFAGAVSKRSSEYRDARAQLLRALERRRVEVVEPLVALREVLTEATHHTMKGPTE